MSKRDQNWRQDVEEAATRLLASEGYELVLMQYLPRSRVLRLFIDRDQGVGVEECASVSRLLSDWLDGEGVSDKIGERFTLEVSSPGLDRPLVKPAHFQKFIGREAKIKVRSPREGRRNFTGRLRAADLERIEMEVDGTATSFCYGDIESARLVPVF